MTPENGKEEGMEEDNKTGAKSRGGRPEKAVKRDQLLGVKCTILERKVIEYRAREMAVSVSEYLRTLALHPQQLRKAGRVLPKEVLLLTGNLHHLAANINQIAYQGNRGDRWTAAEAIRLATLMSEVQTLVQTIKSYLE